MSDLAPIVVFVYNRINHTKRTLEALKKNRLADKSQLFIFSDGSKNTADIEKVRSVRKYIQNIDGFKKIQVIERNRNMGLAESIISGVTEIVNLYGKIIVLEDDLETSPYFLTYMNEGIKLYKDNPKVASIHGYIYPITGLPESFFIRGADCWGWATWSSSWRIFEKDGKKLFHELISKNLQKEADFNNSYEYTKMLKDQINGKNNSWAVRWYLSAFLKDKLSLYPGKSYVQNIGHDIDATHCTTETDLFNIDLNKEFRLSKINVNEDMHSKIKMENYFNKIRPSTMQKIKSKFVNFLK